MRRGRDSHEKLRFHRNKRNIPQALVELFVDGGKYIFWERPNQIKDPRSDKITYHGTAGKEFVI